MRWQIKSCVMGHNLVFYTTLRAIRFNCAKICGKASKETLVKLTVLMGNKTSIIGYHLTVAFINFV